MKSVSYIVLICLVVAVLAVLVPIAAQQPGPAGTAYSGVDLLFVIDQSGSMGGAAFGSPQNPAPSDPLGLRFIGPQYALDWLADYLNALPEAVQPDVRVAVLAFGTGTRPLLQWVDVDVTAPDWPDQLRARQDLLAPGRFGSTNLIYTNFLGAFAEAKRLLDSAPPATTSGNRLQAVVVLTDGAPCVPPARDGTIDCLTLPPSAITSHMEELAAFTRQSLPNTLVYVIAIEPEGNDPNQPKYWDDVAPLWRAVVCGNGAGACPPVQAARVTTAPEISRQFNEVLVDLMGRVDSAVSGVSIAPDGSFTFPPYQQNFRLSVFKSAPEPLQGLQVIAPDGSPATVARDGLDTPIETYTRDLPAPGLWRVDSSNVPADSVLDFQLSLTAIEARVRPNVNTTQVGRFEPYSMSISVIDNNGQPLAVYEGDVFPLTVELHQYDIADAQRATPLATYQAVRQDQPTPINTFTWDHRFREAGRYEIRADVFYQGTSGPVYLVQDEVVVPEVEVTGAAVAWNAPSPNDQLPGGTYIIEATLQNAAGGTPIGGVEGLVMRVRTTDANGQVVTEETIPVTEDPARPGTFSLPLPLTAPGNFETAAELGFVDPATGQFTPLDATASQTFTYQVRPPNPLSVVLVQPAPGSVAAFGPPPYFWRRTPTQIRVEVRDANNIPVDLDFVTNGAETLPTLTVTRGGAPVTLPGALAQVGPGTYTLETTTLGLGEYTFEAAVVGDADAILPEYVWDQTRITPVTQTRIVPPFIYMIAGGALILLAALTLLLFVAFQRGPSYPLGGTLLLLLYDDRRRQYEQVAVISLANANRPTVRLRAKELVPPFQSITVTNNNSVTNINMGVIYIEEIQFSEAGNALMAGRFPLQGGDRIPVIEVERDGTRMVYAVGFEGGARQNLSQTYVDFGNTGTQIAPPF